MHTPNLSTTEETVKKCNDQSEMFNNNKFYLMDTNIIPEWQDEIGHCNQQRRTKEIRGQSYISNAMPDKLTTGKTIVQPQHQMTALLYVI